ncbi:MAG TPA: AI-2E family transporter [Polyangiaceae bacterium]
MTAQLDTARARAGAVPLRPLVIGLVALAVIAVVPLWAPLVLAVWTANLLEPLAARFARKLKGRGRTALVLTTLVVLLILVPLTVLTVSVVATTAELATKLRSSKQLTDVLHLVVPAGVGPSLTHLNPQRIADFARQHGGQAAGFAQAALGGLTAVAVGLVIYVFGVFQAIANGSRAVAWLRERSFVSRGAFDRLAGAFIETGRGLFVGIGGTALLQGTVATIGYVVIGVPQPLLLGFITMLAALIPSLGTALVWVPLTVLLFATGRTSAGIALIVFGCIASTIDNLLAPWLARYGKLKLPTFVTLVAILGGIVMFGGFGLILGPLFVRLGVEALDLWRERRVTTHA